MDGVTQTEVPTQGHMASLFAARIGHWKRLTQCRSWTPSAARGNIEDEKNRPVIKVYVNKKPRSLQGKILNWG